MAKRIAFFKFCLCLKINLKNDYFPNNINLIVLKTINKYKMFAILMVFLSVNVFFHLPIFKPPVILTITNSSSE